VCRDASPKCRIFAFTTREAIDATMLENHRKTFTM
jgi:hypothetical protein